MEPTTCVEGEPFALLVTDDSMEPEFARGCVITVDPTGVASDGAFVLAELAERFVLRQLRAGDDGWTLVALRPGIAPIALGSDRTALRGVITQRAGRRRRDHKRYDVSRPRPRG
jgi:SOS-response transcriptional repressor LexA